MALNPTQDSTASEPHSEGRSLVAVGLERYQVTGELGEGGIGRVVRAVDLRLNREVAVKLLRKLSAANEERFFAEAEITARLEHPAIVPVHDVGRWHTGEPFYAMKRVSGQSLKDVVGSRPTLEQRLPLLANVLTVSDAVAYAHSQKVIHRDLKPSNVMVGDFGETLVIDWGLARLADEAAQPSQPTPRAGAGSAGAGAGTPNYMAPELAVGASADARSDVYALGSVLYEVLSGSAPYEGADRAEVFGRLASGPPRPLPPAVPEDLAAIVTKAMHRAPSERYPNAGAFGADLRRYLEGQYVGAYRYSPWQRAVRLASGNKPATAVLVGSLVALSVVGTFSVRRIVAERDAARAAEGRAELSQTAAESRRDQLLLAQANMWLERDPTIAFAWLKAFAATPSANSRAVSAVAASAVSRGVARQLTRGRKHVAVSPDSQTLAGLLDEQVVLWTVDDATARALGTPSGAVRALRFTQDGQGLLVSERDGLSRWAVTGAARERLLDAGEPLVVVSTDGPFEAAGGQRGGVWLRRLGEPFVKVRQRAAPITRLQFDLEHGLLLIADLDEAFEVLRLADSRVVAGGPSTAHSLTSGLAAWGDASGTVFLKDLASGQTRSWARQHEGVVADVVVARQGRFLVSMGQDHHVVSRDLNTGVARSFTQSGAWVLRGVLSNDQQLLLASGQDHVAHVWDLSSGTYWALKGHTASLRTFAFTADDRYIVTGDSEGEVRVWATPRPRARTLVDAHQSQYAEAHFLPDGRTVTAGEDGRLNWWNPNSGERTTLQEAGSGGSLTAAGQVLANAGTGGLFVHRALAAAPPTLSVTNIGELHQVALNPEGTQLATAGADHAVRLFELGSGRGQVLGNHPAAAWHVAFSPSGQWLASTGDDLPVHLWPLEGGQPRELPGPEGIVYDLRFSPDGHWLAAAGLGPTVWVWSVPDFVGHRLEGHRALVRQLAFSPDSHRLATASDDHTARVWTLGAPDAPLVLEHGGQVAAVAFAHDGQQLVSAANVSLRRWDTRSGTLIAEYRDHTGEISGLEVSPDGTAVLTAAEDRSVRYWPAFFDPASRGAGDAEALSTVSSVTLQDDVALSPSHSP